MTHTLKISRFETVGFIDEFYENGYYQKPLYDEKSVNSKIKEFENLAKELNYADYTVHFKNGAVYLDVDLDEFISKMAYGECVITVNGIVQCHR